MLTVTERAAALLKAAKAAEGAPDDAGIRIRRGVTADESKISVGFAIRRLAPSARRWLLPTGRTITQSCIAGVVRCDEPALKKSQDDQK